MNDISAIWGFFPEMQVFHKKGGATSRAEKMMCGFLHQQFYSEIEFSWHTNKNKSDQTNKQTPILCLFFPQKSLIVLRKTHFSHTKSSLKLVKAQNSEILLPVKLAVTAMKMSYLTDSLASIVFQWKHILEFRAV